MLASTDLLRQLHHDRHQRLVHELSPEGERRLPPTRPTLTLVVAVPDASKRRDAA